MKRFSLEITATSRTIVIDGNVTKVIQSGNDKVNIPVMRNNKLIKWFDNSLLLKK